jgi:hypothetical protein
MCSKCGAQIVLAYLRLDSFRVGATVSVQQSYVLILTTDR